MGEPVYSRRVAVRRLACNGVRQAGSTGITGGRSMGLRALTFATDIKGRLAGSVMAALTLASIGSAAFAMPAAARASTESATDSIRSGPYASRHVSRAPVAG